MANNYYSDSTNTNVIPIIRVGEVISVTDNTKSGRIKVRITGIDDKETDNSLINCVPLLPKYLTILPKVGECVFVFQYEHKDSSPSASFKNKRFWLGPLITQPTKLEGEFYNSSLSILPDGYAKLKDPNLEEGSYGNDEDIVLQGRFNTDIVQKDREMWLRVGKTVEGSPEKFNTENIGFIQLKYGGEKLNRKIVNKEVITFVTEPVKINIFATLNTITEDGTILTGDLPKDSYIGSNINRTEVFIKVTNAQTGQIVTSFENENINGPNSRELALKVAKNFIDINRGNAWKIKSRSNDLIDIYNGNNGVAIFKSEPIEVKKIIPEVLLEKGKAKTNSVINVVANKINLISHDGEHDFNLTDPKSLVTNEEQEVINTQAHPIVYGDKLLEFLVILQNYVKSHKHPHHNLRPDPSTIVTNVTDFPLDTLLNKNINTN